MTIDIKQGLRATGAKSLVTAAEARGFEPRMGANPNRISSPFAPAKTLVGHPLPAESAQVSAVALRKAPEPATARREPRCAIAVPPVPRYEPGRRMRAKRIRRPLATHPLHRKDSPR
jgi:hypothetical protein